MVKRVVQVEKLWILDITQDAAPFLAAKARGQVDGYRGVEGGAVFRVPLGGPRREAMRAASAYAARIGHRRRGAVLGRLISGPGVFWATGPFAEAAPIWDPKGGR